MHGNCFLPGKQFQTFNVHQLLHLPEVVKDLGPLWSNSCFPFEDYIGDLRELFHGTKNVDGQVCFHIMFMFYHIVYRSVHGTRGNISPGIFFKENYIESARSDK